MITFDVRKLLIYVINALHFNMLFPKPRTKRLARKLVIMKYVYTKQNKRDLVFIILFIFFDYVNIILFDIVPYFA